MLVGWKAGVSKVPFFPMRGTSQTSVGLGVVKRVYEVYPVVCELQNVGDGVV